MSFTTNKEREDMKTLYVYGSPGMGAFLRTELSTADKNPAYEFIGTLEIQEPPKEKKWVKRTDLIPDGREGTMTHLPIRKYRNAVLTYEVLEDDTK